MIQQIWRYRSFVFPPVVKHGVGAVRAVAEEVRTLGLSRPLIVTDKGVASSGALERVMDLLREAGIAYEVFDEVIANPPVATVAAGTRMYRERECDGLIGLGGGSAMDTAKAIGVEVTHGGTILDYEYGKRPLQRRIAPLINIPTTAGTGSEATLWAVITDPARRIKFNVGGPEIASWVAIIDPELHVSMPAPVTAGTGIDALSHAYECYTCHFAQPHTDSVALLGTEYLAKYLRRAYANARDLEARYFVAMGAHLAGLAYGTESAGAIHAMSQTLGGIIPTMPHGLCNAAIMPAVMEYNWQGNPEKHRRFAEALGINTAGMSDREAGLAAARWMADLCADLDVPPLAHWGVTPEMVPMIALEASRDPQTVGNCRDITVREYEQIYRRLVG